MFHWASESREQHVSTVPVPLLENKAAEHRLDNLHSFGDDGLSRMPTAVASNAYVVSAHPSWIQCSFNVSNPCTTLL
jgi:hypothetical protein